MAPEPRPRRSCRHRNSGNPNVNIPSGSPSYHNRRSNANVDVNNGQTSVSWTGDQGSTFNLNSGTGGTNVNYSSNGSGDDTDCSDDEDNHSSGGSGSSGYNPYSTSTSTSGAESLPNSAQLVKAGGDDGNKLAPIAVIVPVVVGVALLLLGIGFFVIWRKRRAAAREGSVEEASGESANAGSQAEMRGGEGQMTGTVIGLVGPTKYEIPPTYEASSRDRSVASSGEASEVNPFADPVVADGTRRGSDGSGGHNGRGLVA